MDLHIGTVSYIKVFLLRVLRQCDVENRSVAACILWDEHLFHECPVGLKHLYAVVSAIANVEQAVIRECHTVHRSPELLSRWITGIIGRQLHIIGLVTVRTPMALILA